MEDKDKRSCFFEKTFLLTDIGMDIAFGMLFLILSNVKINFTNRKLRWKLYTTAKVLPTTQQIQLFRKKEFAIAALDPENESL